MIHQLLQRVFGRQPKLRYANCSFCRKSYREVGPLVEGPDRVYICGECAELVQTIIAEEKRRRREARVNADDAVDGWHPPSF